MNFTLTPDEEKWRQEVREGLREAVDDELFAQMRSSGEPEGPAVRRFMAKLSERGWLGMSWPREYGGLEKSAVSQLIFFEEIQYLGAPMPSLTITSVAPTIMRFGTEENRREWIPPIVAGEVETAIGYSEPDAGTDLASLQTRAVLDGDEWVISGQKIWNTAGHVATHEWLAVRTDPDAPKHKGVSVIIVPLAAPGIEIQPMWTWGGVRTNQVFFDGVRVPRTNLIGEENRGWYYIMAALDFERMSIGSFLGSIRRTFETTVEYCRRTTVDGEVLANRPDVRETIARLERDIEVGRLFLYRTAAAVDAGAVPTIEGSMQKVFVSELQTRVADWGTRLLGLAGQLATGDAHAPLDGALEAMYRRAPVLRFGGGTNEIQRNIIAQRGLGLPR